MPGPSAPPATPLREETPQVIDLRTGRPVSIATLVRRRVSEREIDTAAAVAPDRLTSDPVRLYLDDIGRRDLLTYEEEADLAKRGAASRAATAVLGGATDAALSPEQRRRLRTVISDGDAAAARMVEANLRLVVSIARRYSNRGLMFPDLIQEGNLGLIRAVQKFDHSRGYRFSTYATWWIRQALGRAVADQSRLIRVPAHVAETIQRLTRSRRTLQQRLGREATSEELATDIGLPVERVEELLRLDRDPASLDAPIGDEGAAAFGDLIEDADAVVPADAASYLLLQRHLADVLHELPDREREVVELRFGLRDGRQRTLDEVGVELGVTRERARQIEARALSKLRHPSFVEQLKGYLDA